MSVIIIWHPVIVTVLLFCIVVTPLNTSAGPCHKVFPSHSGRPYTDTWLPPASVSSRLLLLTVSLFRAKSGSMLPFPHTISNCVACPSNVQFTITLSSPTSVAAISIIPLQGSFSLTITSSTYIIPPFSLPSINAIYLSFTA